MDNSKFLCKLIEKKMDDDINSDPQRVFVLKEFKKYFELVRFGVNNCIVCAADIDNVAFFISQIGVFQYVDKNTGVRLNIEGYLEKEYTELSCTRDFCYTEGIDTIPCDEPSCDYIVSPIIRELNGKACMMEKVGKETLSSLLIYLEQYYLTITMAIKNTDIFES